MPDLAGIGEGVWRFLKSLELDNHLLAGRKQPVRCDHCPVILSLKLRTEMSRTSGEKEMMDKFPLESSSSTPRNLPPTSPLITPRSQDQPFGILHGKSFGNNK